MEEKPNYYAIIPASVRYDNNLKMGEKLMYGEITSLTFKTGECWASNNYFAELYNVSPQAISKWIKTLETYKYITIDYEKKGNQYIKRIIKLVSTDIDRVSTVVERGINTHLEGYQQRIKENIININNTSINNNIYSPEAEQHIPYKEIIDYLNMRLNTKYKHTSKKTQTLIKARFNEGFTLDDFKQVIDKKCVEWINDTKMNKFLRPETLFGTKFESYLNQQSKKITTKDLKIDFSDF